MTKEKVVDFVILALRWYLIWYMISYGWSKLTMSQFGVHNSSILDAPLKELDQFYVAWYLYGESQFFNYFTGAAEIIGAILLLFNRTVLLGAFLVLIILGQIFIIDVAFTTGMHGFSLPIRIFGMMLSAVSIMYYYKERLVKTFEALTKGVTTKVKYKWWMFLILPVIGFLLDFVFAIFLMPIKMGLEKLFL